MSDTAIQLGRREVLTGALGIAGAAFIAFGPRSTRDVPAGRKVVDYWEKWTQHEGRAMQEVVDLFNASQDQHFVRYMVTAGIDQKARIAIAGGLPPDLIGLWNYNVPEFAETRAAYSLEELGVGDRLPLERYARAVRPILTHPDSSGTDRMWAVPNTGGTLALYYNKKLFREIGVDQPPRTISELDSIAQRLDVIGADGEIKRAGFMHIEPGWWSAIWGMHFGGSLYDAASNRSLATCDAYLRAARWVQDYSRKLGTEASLRFKSGFANEYSSPRNALLDGKVAMVVQGPWLANVINRFVPDFEYGVAPMPVADELYDPAQPIGLVESDILIIPRGAPNPEGALEFLLFTQRQEIIERLSIAHFKNTTLAHASDDFLRNHLNKGVRVFNEIADSPRGVLVPRTRAWPECKDQMDGAVQRLWMCEESAERIMESVRVRSQSAMDRTLEMKNRRA